MVQALDRAMCNPVRLAAALAARHGAFVLALVVADHLLHRQHGEADNLFGRAARRQRIALLDGVRELAVFLQFQGHRCGQQQGVGESRAEGVVNGGWFSC